MHIMCGRVITTCTVSYAFYSTIEDRSIHWTELMDGDRLYIEMSALCFVYTDSCHAVQSTGELKLIRSDNILNN